MVEKRSYSSPLRRQRAAETRRKILDAVPVVLAKGLNALTMPAVAKAASVSLPTVYRYFGSADELFNAAAVTASGGYLERMRSRTMQRGDPVERVVEAMVISISEIPDDPYLEELFRMRDAVSVHAANQNAFVSNELRLYFGDQWKGDDQALDEFAEILLRLLKSFLDDPGPERDVAELRRYLSRWLIPMLRPRYL